MNKICGDNRPHGGTEEVNSLRCGNRNKSQHSIPLGELTDREVGAFTYADDVNEFGLR